MPVGAVGGILLERFMNIRQFPRHHIYPVIVILLLIVGTVTAVSGSSIGMYHLILGHGKDPSLILNEPRGIRGDEWQLITTKTIAQSFNDYNSFNPNIGVDGENVSLRPDIPTTDFNTLFRPQNWGFFFMPLENAIAFKWWFFTAFVLVTAYYFVRRFFTKNITLGVLLSLFLIASPLPQWTYREFVFLVLGFGMLGVILADWLQLQYYKKQLKHSWKRSIKIAAAVMGLGSVGVGYVLVLYPPMQIAIAVILLAFFIDVVRRRKLEYNVSFKQTLVAQRFLLASLAVVAAIGGVIFAQQKPTITALANTEHPGVRHFESGYTSKTFDRARNLFIGGSMPLVLQKDSALAHSRYFLETNTGNQSEASNYVWLLPLLVFVILYGYKQSKRKLKLPVSTLGAAVFLGAWMLIPNMSLPVIDQVHPNRWNLAVGLVTFLLLGFAIQGKKYITEIKKSWDAYAYYIACGSFIVLNFVLFLGVKSQFPALIGKTDAIVFIILAIAGPALLVFGRFRTGLISIVGVSLLVNLNVNPMYRGVGAATENTVVQTIRDVDRDQPGTWLMATDVVSFEHLPLLAGAKSFTTHFTYPQEFWKYLDPDNKQDNVYNRAAHTQVSLTNDKTNIYLKSINTIGVNLNPCDESVIRNLDIKYIVIYSQHENLAKCMSKVTTATGAGTTVYNIYRTDFESAP